MQTNLAGTYFCYDFSSGIFLCLARFLLYVLNSL